MAAKKHKSTRSSRKVPMTTLLSALLIVLLIVRDAFAGPLRMALQVAHLSALWFSFDAILLLGLVIQLALGLRSKTGTRRAAAAISVLMIAVPVVTGFLMGNNPISIVSGYKILAPLLLCLNTPLIADELVGRYFYLWLALLAATLLFLVLNQAINFEWVGASISQFGQKKDVSRLWYAQSAQRYAGATVASVSAAGLLVLFYCLIRPKVKSIWFELLVVAACAYGIYLTDSKTSNFCLLLIFVCGNYGKIVPTLQRTLNQDVSRYCQVAISYLFLGVGIVPLIIGFVSEPNAYFRYNSFLDRVKFTWPSALDRISELGGMSSFITGTGFGSFGSPSYYSLKYIPITSDVDNYLIYLVAIYGLPVVALYFVCSRTILKAESAALCFFAAMVPYALSTNCEMPEALLVLGLGVSAVIYGRNKVQYLPWTPRIKLRTRRRAA